MPHIAPPQLEFMVSSSSLAHPASISHYCALSLTTPNQGYQHKAVGFYLGRDALPLDNPALEGSLLRLGLSLLSYFLSGCDFTTVTVEMLTQSILYV